MGIYWGYVGDNGKENETTIVYHSDEILFRTFLPPREFIL